MLGVGAIRIKFEGPIHQLESFLEIVCLQGVIGEFLGAPLGVVLFPSSSQLGKATAAGQFRKSGVCLIDALELLAFQ